MSKLIAVVYPTETIAQQALERLRLMARGKTVTLLDAVVVTRGSDGGVRLAQSLNTTAIGAVSGMFWGSLLGLIFLAPLVGAAIGAAAGALGGYVQDFGIDDEFMRELGASLTPGSAALFILVHDMTEDKVAATLGVDGGKLFYSSLSAETESHLRSAIDVARSKPGGIAKPVDAIPTAAAGAL